MCFLVNVRLLRHATLVAPAHASLPHAGGPPARTQHDVHDHDVAHCAAAGRFLEPYLDSYDACVFSTQEYVRPSVAHKSVVIRPGIAPLTAKNRELSAVEVAQTLMRAGLLPELEGCSSGCDTVEPPFSHKAMIYHSERSASGSRGATDGALSSQAAEAPSRRDTTDVDSTAVVASPRRVTTSTRSGHRDGVGQGRLAFHGETPAESGRSESAGRIAGRWRALAARVKQGAASARSNAAAAAAVQGLGDGDLDDDEVEAGAEHLVDASIVSTAGSSPTHTQHDHHAAAGHHLLGPEGLHLGAEDADAKALHTRDDLSGSVKQPSEVLLAAARLRSRVVSPPAPAARTAAVADTTTLARNGNATGSPGPSPPLHHRSSSSASREEIRRWVTLARHKDPASSNGDSVCCESPAVAASGGSTAGQATASLRGSQDVAQAAGPQPHHGSYRHPPVTAEAYEDTAFANTADKSRQPAFFPPQAAVIGADYARTATSNEDGTSASADAQAAASGGVDADDHHDDDDDDGAWSTPSEIGSQAPASVASPTPSHSSSSGTSSASAGGEESGFTGRGRLSGYETDDSAAAGSEGVVAHHRHHDAAAVDQGRRGMSTPRPTRPSKLEDDEGMSDAAAAGDGAAAGSASGSAAARAQSEPRPPGDGSSAALSHASRTFRYVPGATRIGAQASSGAKQRHARKVSDAAAAAAVPLAPFRLGPTADSTTAPTSVAAADAAVPSASAGVVAACGSIKLDSVGFLARPVVTQVSRWDRLKGWHALLRAWVDIKTRIDHYVAHVDLAVSRLASASAMVHILMHLRGGCHLRCPFLAVITHPLPLDVVTRASLCKCPVDCR